MSIVTGEATQKIKEQLNIGPSEETQQGIEKLRQMFPEKEMAEVRHGRWISATRMPKSPDGLFYWNQQPEEVFECSECGRTENEKEPYCHCGAKMDRQERIKIKIFPKKKAYGVKWHPGGLDYDYSYWAIVDAYNPKHAQHLFEKEYGKGPVIMMVKEVESNG